jgi:transglutaminase-like putative cysteine protease
LYQRLSIDDQGAPYSLHGFNAVYLSEFGWYRLDPRGNREGINAQFTPPIEQLAYHIRLPEEVDFQSILAEPLPLVIETLQTYNRRDEVLSNLPDLSIEFWNQSGQHVSYGNLSYGNLV